jgi:hypothetical protein
MSANSGAWGVAMFKDGYSEADGLQVQEQGISLEGGDPVLPYLPTTPLGCLLIPPAGLGVPGVRSGDVAFAQRDGVVQFADYYEPRQITLQVIVENDGCPGCTTGMSARQKVSRLTQEWSRNCSGASLVLFTDCHDPNATDEEKIYKGPYLVHGRPRVADVTWERSNRGMARVTLRFDAADARLILLNALGPDFVWDSEQVQTLDAGEQNLNAEDYRLEGRTMTLNGATVVDTFPASGAPDGGSYFSREFIAANTSSPMTMDVTASGLGAIPATAAATYTVSWWAQKSVVGGPQTRTNMAWYNAAGGLISTTVGTNMNAATSWSRHDQVFVAPALTAFMKPILAWSGTALVGQVLDFAQVWVIGGGTATGPETVEVVGTLCACPVISLFPDMTAPIVVTYGGHEFTYTEDVTSVVDIDTRWGRAAEGFTDVTQNLEGDFSSCLPPGVHDVTMSTGDPTDTGFVNIVWENAVVSG